MIIIQNKLKKYITLLIVVPLFTLLISCNTTTPPLKFNKIDTQNKLQKPFPDTWFLQRQLFKMSNQSPKWHDERLINNIKQVAKKIEQSIKLPNNFVEVSLRGCPERNVQAFRGGWINFCLPLALSVEFEDEVAFVLSHEIAHIMLDHIAQGKDGNDLYLPSIEQELEADELGLKLMVSAGYQPEGALIFFDKLEYLPGQIESEKLMTKRYSSINHQIETLYTTEHGSRNLTELSNDYKKGVQYGQVYLENLENHYQYFVTNIRAGNKIKNNQKGDVTRRQACINFYAMLYNSSIEMGFSEVLIHAATAANFRCFMYSGVAESYGKLIGSPDVKNISFNTLAAMLLTAISINTPNYVMIENKVIAELKRRIYSDLDNLPDIHGSLKRRAIASSTQSQYTLTCRLLGEYDFEWATQHFYKINNSQRKYLLTKLNGKKNADLISGYCIDDHKAGQKLKNQLVTKHARKRFKYSGNTLQQAKNIAERSARLSITAGYVNDMNAISKLTQRRK